MRAGGSRTTHRSPLAADRPSKPSRAQGRPRSLKARAIALLARREYSRVELRGRLSAGDGAAGADAAAVDAVLDELTALGYLSDARYAQAVVRQKTGGYSRRAIVETLKARGVPGPAAVEALADAGVDDHDALVALWRRRFGRPPADDREKARQVRFLQSRGFALAAIFRLLRDPPLDDGSPGA
jgi:regulatory protein